MAEWLGARGYEVAIDRTNEDRRSPVSLLYARRRTPEVDETARSSRAAGRTGGPVTV
jgi:hypothetical protein